MALTGNKSPALLVDPYLFPLILAFALTGNKHTHTSNKQYIKIENGIELFPAPPRPPNVQDDLAYSATIPSGVYILQATVVCECSL